MKIFILTMGSRGDVQPYVALGKGLKSAGHQVTLCTSCRFESFITSHGLTYGYMNDGIIELMESAAGRDAMENTTNPLQWVKTAVKLSRRTGPITRATLADAWQAVQKTNPDLIIYHPKAFGGAHFAEKLGIPAAMALLFPLYVPTAAFPCVGFPSWNRTGWYNRFTYKLTLKATSLGIGKFIKEWRGANGLGPLRRGVDFLHTNTGAAIPVLHGFSEHLLPAPSDWPSSAVVTGYWFLPRQDDWQPPAALADFLDSGDPPVYVGFGSIAGQDPRGLTHLVVEALQRAGVRGIVATGWGGLEAGDFPETVFTIDSVPHDWLFPRMAAVVHHGGAGTTAAGLRAGCPTIICPFFGDQPFWGRLVRSLGAGSEPIPRKQLTAGRLAEAILEVTGKPDIVRNAAQVGEKIRRERGIERAVKVIEKLGREVKTPSLVGSP